MATKVDPVARAQERSWKSWLWRLALVALGALAVALLVSRLSGLRGMPVPEEPIVPVVRVETAVVHPLQVYQTYTGTITARERFEVSAQVNATVLAVPKREGDRVIKGELLAMLDATEFRAEVAHQRATIERQQAELAYWEAQLDRNRTLIKSFVVSQQTLEDSERQVRMLRASVNEANEVLSQANTRLGYTEVRAPSDGFVQTVYALPGDLARAGAPLMELLDDRALKVTVTLPQSDLATLTTGAPAVVEITSLGYGHSGVLDRLYPALDVRTRTATGEVFLGDATENLRPGMLASVSLRLFALDAAITVPVHAIHYRNGLPGVFVDNTGRAEWRNVQTGFSVGERVHIVGGVDAGAAVIVTPDSRLADGVAVKRVTGEDTL